MVNEHNIKNSFRSVKADILRIEGQILNILQEQAKFKLELEKLNSKNKKTKAKKTTKKKK